MRTVSKFTKSENTEQKESGRRQRELLRRFDADLFTYTGQIAWFLPGFFSFISLIMIAIPAQEVLKEEEPFLVIWTMCVFSGGISMGVLWPYTILNDGFTPRQKNARIWRKLRYLPVSRRQFVYVRIGYLHRYFWKLAAAGLALQCLFTLGIEKHISIMNILYVVIVLYLLPMFCGIIQLLTDGTGW